MLTTRQGPTAPAVLRGWATVAAVLLVVVAIAWWAFGSGQEFALAIGALAIVGGTWLVLRGLDKRQNGVASAMALGGLGATLLFAALIVTVVLGARTIGGYDWPASAVVPDDGRSHVMQLDPDRDTLLWALEAYGDPVCTATANGKALSWTETDRSYRRDGKIADYVAVQELAAGPASVELRCKSGGAFVLEPRPHLPASLSAWGDRTALPLLLGVLGVSFVGYSASRLWRRAQRRTGA